MRGIVRLGGRDVHVAAVVDRCRGRNACLRPSQRLMQCACRHGCRKQERAVAGGGDAARRRGRRLQCCRAMVLSILNMSYVERRETACGATMPPRSTRKATQGVFRTWVRVKGTSRGVGEHAKHPCPADPGTAYTMVRTNTRLTPTTLCAAAPNRSASGALEEPAGGVFSPSGGLDGMPEFHHHLNWTLATLLQELLGRTGN